jgi:hypothetical protein
MARPVSRNESDNNFMAEFASAHVTKTRLSKKAQEVAKNIQGPASDCILKTATQIASAKSLTSKEREKILENYDIEKGSKKDSFGFKAKVS